MKIALQQHQQNAVSRIVDSNDRGGILYFATGSGKTLTSIAAAEALMARDTALRTVVVCPAALLTNFENELVKAQARRARFDILSYHGFVKAYEHRNRTAPLTLKDRILVFDEAHNLRNPACSLSQVAVHVAPSASKIILLSGTIVQNRPADIAPLLCMLKPSCVPVSQASFEDRYGASGMRTNQSELRRALRRTVAHYKPDPAATGFPTMEVREVFVTMYPAQAVAHRKAIKGLPIMDFGDLGNSKNLLSFLSGPRRIANAVKVDGKVHASKLETVATRVAAAVGQGRKSIVYSCFLDYGIDVLRDMLTARGIRFAVICGEQNREAKEKARLLYNGREVLVLLFSKAGSEGMSLTDTNYVHLVEPGWNDANMQQVVGRSRRLGSHAGGHGTHVVVYKYVSILPKKPAPDRRGMSGSETRQIGKPNTLSTRTADEILADMSRRKEETNKRFLQMCVRVGGA